jgi:hypothetical protein
VAGQVQYLHCLHAGQVLGKTRRIPALFDHQVEAKLACGIENGGLFSLEVEYVDTARRCRHEHEAETVISERWWFAGRTEPTHRAVA